jgi:arylsulfatase A-like enzyme
MPRLAAAALVAACLWSLACGTPAPPPGPLRLLEVPTLGGGLPRVGALESAGETRPALLESARFRVARPEAGQLTFGAAVAWAGAGEAPGWYRLRVRLDGEPSLDRRWNPRAMRGFRDLTLPLPAGAGELEVEFEIGLEDREGRPLERPDALLLGVAEPTLHDARGYGQAPVVVLVSIDTLRRDYVGAYGQPKPTSPHLDALAAGGRLFDDAVATSSWTLPSHLSMLTSLDPGVHGGTDMEHGLATGIPTLAGRLAEAGWATQAITSHLYVSAVYGLDAGFDHLSFHQDRKAEETADRAIALLDRLGDRPLFLFLHFYDPHWHYAPPPEFLAHFEQDYTGDLTGLWQDFSNRDRASLSGADLRHLLALYAGEIRILNHMRERGIDRNALVLVTSDHGEEFLEHGAWEHQRTLYEEVIRIPLVLAGPRVEPGRESAPVSLLDVTPTVLDWAVLPPLAGARGLSLLAPLGEREAYGETDHTTDDTRKLFLRAGSDRWKAILSLSRDGERVAAEEWYDLATDPAEAASQRPRDGVATAIRERAIARWRAGRAGQGSAPAVSLTDEQRERLRALGYMQP